MAGTWISLILSVVVFLAVTTFKSGKSLFDK